jgi:hypothetical protein
MPNWCRNRLTIEGPAAMLRQLFRRYRRGSERISLSFERILPIPNGPVGERWACEAVPGQTNRADLTLGERSWAELHFATAWVPPKEIIERLGGEFPAVRLCLHYYEPGAGFGGQFEIEGGEVTDDCPMSMDPLIQELVNAGVIVPRLGRVAARADGGECRAR